MLRQPVAERFETLGQRVVSESGSGFDPRKPRKFFYAFLWSYSEDVREIL